MRKCGRAAQKRGFACYVNLFRKFVFWRTKTNLTNFKGVVLQCHCEGIYARGNPEYKSDQAQLAEEKRQGSSLVSSFNSERKRRI